MRVDAHAHLWGSELLDVPWMREAPERLRREFGMPELENRLLCQGIDRVVLVAAEETQEGNARLLRLASAADAVGAVVAFADPSSETLAAELEALGRREGARKLRGVRISALESDLSWWSLGEVRRGIGEIAAAGLVVEVLADIRALQPLVELARLRRELTIVVDHLGHPERGTHSTWSAALRVAADADGVFVKVSGAAGVRGDFPELLDEAREVVGTDRLLAGSDWPVSAEGSWERIRDAASGWRESDQDRLLGATAGRVFGIAA
jgi:L-fuconolactonase